MDEALESYIERHVSAEPQLLHDLYRHTNIHHLYGRMCSGNVQGRLLKMLTAMAAPRRVLELGTFTGYSALCIAEALGDGAELHTVEIDDEWADELRAWFARSPHGGKIHLHIGDALEVVPEITTEPWDMVFIDANKRLYRQYLDMVLERVPVGGFILADNTLWDGHILDAETCRDAQSRAIADFNDYVAAHPALEKVILPVRDGLTIMRRVR